MSGAWSSKTVPDLKPFLPQIPDPSSPRAYETEHELVMDTFFFNTMGTDDARGKFDLDISGNLALSFTVGKLASHPVFQKTEEILRAMAQAMGGDFVPFPLWEGFLDRKIVTVHPLGGCPMGGSSSEGVVNIRGQAFNTKSNSNNVHAGLFVMDGSIVPGPLAVNPTLTIVALALKIAQNL
jgi:cholesterol oxidase